MMVGAAVVLVVSILTWNWRTVPEPPPQPEPAPAPERPVVAPPPAPSQVEPAEPAPAFTLDDATELAGPNGVVCPLQPALPSGVARLEADDDEAFAGLAVIAQGWLVLSEVPPEGEGTLHVEGFAPQALRWSEALEGPAQGGCEPSPVTLEPSSSAVVGTVRFAEGREVTVEVCGTPALLDGEAFYADAEPGVDCVVVVRRHLGVVQWEAERVVHPQLGRDAEVLFEAPDIDAVLPLVLEPGGDGLRIVADWAGHDLAGRQLLAIDGEAVEGPPVDVHVAHGGDVGTEAVLTLDGGEEVVVERRALTFDDWLLEQ